MSPNGPVWDVYYYTSPPFGRLKGNAAPPRETLCEIARARGPPLEESTGGARGACSSKRGATFGPLWHSAIIPGHTFLKNPDFWKTVFGSKLSQQSIWLGPVAREENISQKCRAVFRPNTPSPKGGATLGAAFVLCQIYVSGKRALPAPKNPPKERGAIPGPSF